MKKAFKIFGIISASLVLLVIAGIIIIPLVVDPNDYKNDISGYVQNAVARDLSIKGDIELSVFPWIGLKIGPLAIANPPGFGENPMSQAQQADMKLRLIPLLRKQLVMKTIVLKGLEVNLVKNQDGSTNWEDLAGKQEEKTEETPEGEKAAGIREILAGLDIEGVKITNAKVTLDDRMQKTLLQINDLNLETGRLKLNESCPLDLNFRVDSTQPLVKAGLDLKTEVMLLFNEEQAILKDTRLLLGIDEMKPEGQEQGRPISGTGDIAAHIFINWGMSHLKLEELSLNSKLKGRQIPGGEADLTLKAGLDLDWKEEAVNLSDLIATLDQTSLDGGVNLSNFKRPKIKFDLNMGDINIDKYLPQPAEKGKKSVRKKSESGSGKGAERFANLDINGTLRIAALSVRKMRFSDVRMSAHSKNVNTGKPVVLDLQFNLASTEPIIRTGVDLKTEIGLFPDQEKAALNNTRLSLAVDEFNPEPQKKETALSGTGNLAGNLLVNWNAGRFKANGLSLKSNVRGKQVPGGEADLALTGGADLDWKKGNLKVTDLNLSGYDMRVTGNVSSSGIFSSPQIKTNLNIAEFSLKKLMRKLGATPPETNDPKALDRIAAAFSLTGSQNAINISNLRATVDRTTLSGNADISSFKPLKASFNLAADEIDADRYLGPPPPIKDGKGNPRKPPGSPEILKKTDINGALRISQFRFRKLHASDVRLSIAGKDGRINIKPLSAQFYRGKLNTEIAVDIARQIPEANLSMNLSGVDMGAFIQKVAGKKFLIGGQTHLSLTLKSQGETILSHLKTLNGSAGLKSKKAVLEGYSIPGLIEQSGYPLDALLAKLGTARKLVSRTDIKAIDARFEIQNGKLLTKDFSLSTPNDRVTVSGAANLADQTLDCKISVDLDQRMSIPIIVKGPFQNPTFSADVAGIVTREVIKKIAELPVLKEEEKKLIKKISELPVFEKEDKEGSVDPGEVGKKIIENPVGLGLDIIKGFGIGGRNKEEKKE